MSRQYLLEWPLTSLSAFAAYAIWRAEGYENKRWAYVAGLAVGLAALAKQTF
ncbi:MAG: hypothetical protein M5R36_05825 [Deltaproteobacteria bacterium]|nr:hypothetical protein [Deltaproteobacteria bacterium]